MLCACALVVWACCNSSSIKLGRMADFLAGVFEVSFEVEVDASFSTSFDGDLAGWADIPSFDEGRVIVDLSAASFTRGQLAYDLDWDVVDEQLELRLARDGLEDVLFIAWRGDQYTSDNKVCYLGWSEAGEATVAAAVCGEQTGAMYCTMPRGGDDGEMHCEACDESGHCLTCDPDGTVKECLPDKASGGSVDLDVDIDVDVDIDADVDLATAGPGTADDR
jgi:hypothetical protein